MRSEVRFQPPTDPAKVRPERRAPVVADEFGRPRLYNDLTGRQQERFDAQLAAWRAGCALIVAADEYLLTGVAPHKDMVSRWYQTRDELEFQTWGRLKPSTVERIIRERRWQ